LNPTEQEPFSSEPTEQPTDEKQKKQTNPKDPVFKAVMKDYFESSQLAGFFTVTLGMQVGQLQLEIDTSIDAISDVEIVGRLAATPFWFFKRHNFVEYKSVNDDLDEENFALILGRAFMGYSKHSENERDEVISCIITDAYPSKIFKRLRTRGSSFRKVKGYEGLYYHRGINFPIYMVVCNRLPVVPLYYSLLMFASGKKLDAYFSQFAVDMDMQIFLKYVVKMYPKQGGKIAQEVEQKMTATEAKDLARTLVGIGGAFAEGLFEAVPGEVALKEGIKKLDADEIASILGEERQLSPEEIELLKKLLSKGDKN
jgi:hypothetical protein